METGFDSYQKTMESNMPWKGKTNLSMKQNLILSNLCHNGTYLKYDQLYKQMQKTTTIGSPLAGVTANLFMENQNEKVLSQCGLLHQICWWYAHDL